MTRRSLTGEVRSIVEGTHTNPHSFLGHHGGLVRVWRPGASSVVVAGEKADRIDEAGLFEAKVPDSVVAYGVEVEYPNGASYAFDDPYRHWPTLGDLDVYLIGEGRHERLWEVLGAHPRVHENVDGTAFAVWAPSAKAVRVVGDFNLWDGRLHPMRAMGASGVWELFVPGVVAGAHYKYEVVGADGALRLRADPMAHRTEVPPGNASIVTRSHHEWGDDQWLSERARRWADEGVDQRLSVYEVHLGSWRRVPEDGGRSLTYRELADQLADHVADLGFTHVELLPVAEHPFGGSWGYQVTSYFAPTARYGKPDDFRYLVDTLHQRGIGVIVDWVPAHFPKDDWALARFDGTALYEHADPRQGEHPDWGTLVFNFGRNEVRNFLVANALYWVEEMHVDGLRVDAVASMLYLDYSRKAGEWVPNKHGGRENLEAIAFLREFNAVVHERHPGVLTIAEESTAFAGVSAPVADGGLGFTHKWNMGWMHDTLDYFSHESVHRKHHQNELSFGLVYAYSERFVLPLSHDEVVHLKGSLIHKMPGDDWQQFANLRALFGWMWAHPGKQLLFMGSELAQRDEWSESRSLDWHLLGHAAHAGIRDLLRELNRVEAGEPGLWRGDFRSEGFRWLSADDADRSTFAFARLDPTGASRPIVVVANLTPVPRYGDRIGVPAPGRWVEVLNTDAAAWGGSGVQATPDGGAWSEPEHWHGQPQSVVLTLPPLSVVYLALE